MDNKLESVVSYLTDEAKVNRVGVLRGLTKIPKSIADKFLNEKRKIIISYGPITINNIKRPANVVGFFHTSGNIYINDRWNYQEDYYERVILHEFGHYLEYSTREEKEVPKDDRERFSDKFVEYTLNPNRLKSEDLGTFKDIQDRIIEMGK